MDRLHDVRDTLTDQHAALDKKVETTRADLAVRVTELGKQDQTVAIGGIKTALWGLVIVAVGIALQTAAAFMPTP